jgi:phage I-like protein
MLNEVQLVPMGRHETRQGAFVLDVEGAEAIAASFNGLANDMVVDYEHQTLTGAEAPAAGWIKRLFVRPDGLWAAVEWTGRAKEYLKNREYRYLSPVFLKDGADRVVRLVNAALTNQPAIDGMEPVVNKSLKFEISNLKSQGGKEVRVMEKLMEALGLTPGASEEEAVGVAMALKAGHSHAEALALELAALKGRLAGLEAEGLVEAAMKEGKVLPPQKEWALEYALREPDGFRAFVAKAPALVMMEEFTKGEAVRREGADGIQRAVNSALGVSDEAFGKYNNLGF